DVDVAVALRQAFGERLPIVAAGLAAVDAKLAFGGIMFAVALDGDDVDGFGLVGVDVDGESEIGGQIAADFAPVFAGVVGAHDIPVLLHENRIGARFMQRDAVHAMPDLGGGIGHEVGTQAVRDDFPCLAAVVGAKASGGGDGDVDAFWIGGIDENCVQPHASGAGRPLVALGKTKPRFFLPVFAAIG